MEPIRFDQVNTTYAKDQPEYSALPACREPNGIATTCWRLSLGERIRLLLTGRLWLQLYTFGQPLQPIYLTTEKPIDDLGLTYAENEVEE